VSHTTQITAQIFGLGYVGLPTAAVFADAGVNVIGVDVNVAAVNSINAGQPHIFEPHLEDLLKKVVSAGKLRATVTPEAADVFVIAVPTPFKDDKQPDLSFVKSASEMIAPLLQAGNLVILESTSPVGTTDQISVWLGELRPDLVFPHQDANACTIHLAHCPERVLPGKVIHEVVHNDRIIGGITPACSEAAVQFYKIAVKGECHVSNARTAELCKLSENTFRDVNIAFANELSLICDRLDIDPWELIALTNRHPRVNILQPGPGVGGHCIAVDPWFIVAGAPEEARLIRTAREVNDAKPHFVVGKVRAAIAQYLAANPDKSEADVTVACFGLAYKPDIDDLRESPAVEIVLTLAEQFAGRLIVVEPNIQVLPAELADRAVLVSTVEAIAYADIDVFLVNHSAFSAIVRSQFSSRHSVDATGRWR
jgi:UDP-N-acetyl-D-mannosaminuronic acid dehydrogenase